MKSSALIVLAISCFAGAANARALDHTEIYCRPDTLKMTCSETQMYIANNDGATLATGNAFGNYQTSYCDTGSNPGSAPAYVRTKDQALCYVGRSCNCHTGYCPQSFWQGVN